MTYESGCFLIFFYIPFIFYTLLSASVHFVMPVFNTPVSDSMYSIPCLLYMDNLGIEQDCRVISVGFRISLGAVV